MKTDGEPAMIAMQMALAEARQKFKTIPSNPQIYNPQATGSAEEGVQDVTDLLRRLTLALEARIKQPLSLQHPMVSRLIRHAAFLLT